MNTYVPAWLTVSRRAAVNGRDNGRSDLRVFLSRQRCACGCGRVADTVCGPPGWRAKALPRDRSRWRAMAYQCAQDEQHKAA